ncbi:MAG: hypothetical protein AAB337_02735 [Patescibacteria group bacterium]
MVKTLTLFQCGWGQVVYCASSLTYPFINQKSSTKTHEGRSLGLADEFEGNLARRRSRLRSSYGGPAEASTPVEAKAGRPRQSRPTWQGTSVATDVPGAGG